MEPTVLDGMLVRHRALDVFLRTHDELSLALEAELIFKKLFVVACGSFFEQRVVAVLECFADRQDVRLSTFVRTRALERRYHDMFDWKAKNANRFLAFFGEAFKDKAVATISAEESLQTAVGAFMELGALRNFVAHDFAASSVDRTTAELEVLYQSALAFVRFLESCLVPTG